MERQNLLEEIEEALALREEGCTYTGYDGKEYKTDITRGKGSKQYIYRRIDMLRENLLQLKKDIQNGEYNTIRYS